MANPQHLEWLKEGVEAWNERRRNEPFTPELSEAELNGAELNGADLSEADLFGADLIGAKLRGADLREADLREAKLRGAKLFGADLIGAKLSGADLREAELYEAELYEAKLRGANLIGAKLRRAKLRGANLIGAELNGADLSEADLFGAYLREANLTGAELNGAELREANLTGAYLSKADLRGAKLRRAKLRWANLIGAELNGADLREAELREAKLFGADLTGADLIGAELREAKLREAKLREAELREADLTGADIRSVKSHRGDFVARCDFTLARNLTQAQVDSMIGDSGVLLPEGLVHPDHWEKLEEFEDERTPEPSSQLSEEEQRNQERERIYQAFVAQAPVLAKITDGKLDVEPGPEGWEPLEINPADLEHLFKGIAHSCSRFIENANGSQLPIAAKKPFEYALSFAQQRNDIWYEWEFEISAIESALTRFGDMDWQELDKQAQTIIGQIEKLEKYLSLAKPPADKQPDDGGVLVLPAYSDELKEAILAPLRELAELRDALEAMTDKAFDFIKQQIEIVGTAVEDAYLSTVVAVQENGKTLWEKALRALGGFAATALKLIYEVGDDTVSWIRDLFRDKPKETIGKPVVSGASWEHIVNPILEILKNLIS